MLGADGRGHRGACPGDGRVVSSCMRRALGLAALLPSPTPSPSAHMHTQTSSGASSLQEKGSSQKEPEATRIPERPLMEGRSDC